MSVIPWSSLIGNEKKSWTACRSHRHAAAHFLGLRSFGRLFLCGFLEVLKARFQLIYFLNIYIGPFCTPALRPRLLVRKRLAPPVRHLAPRAQASSLPSERPRGRRATHRLLLLSASRTCADRIIMLRAARARCTGCSATGVREMCTPCAGAWREASDSALRARLARVVMAGLWGAARRGRFELVKLACWTRQQRLTSMEKEQRAAPATNPPKTGFLILLLSAGLSRCLFEGMLPTRRCGQRCDETAFRPFCSSLQIGGRTHQEQAPAS